MDNNFDQEQVQEDPEFAVSECLRVKNVERLLNETVEVMSDSLHITPSLAKVLLQGHNSALQDIMLQANASHLMISSKVKSANPSDPASAAKAYRGGVCSMCVNIICVLTNLPR